MGCLGDSGVDGVVGKIKPNSIKFLPLRWQSSLLRGLCAKDDSLAISAPADESEVLNLKVRLSDGPPAEEPVCPKGGPPQAWFNKHQMFTKDCAACKCPEVGTSRKGKVHSASCCANYVRWLRTQREEAAEAAEVELRAMYKNPRSEWLVKVRFTLGCEACAALELGVGSFWSCPFGFVCRKL